MSIILQTKKTDCRSWRNRLSSWDRYESPSRKRVINVGRNEKSHGSRDDKRWVTWPNTLPCPIRLVWERKKVLSLKRIPVLCLVSVTHRRGTPITRNLRWEIWGSRWWPTTGKVRDKQDEKEVKHSMGYRKVIQGVKRIKLKRKNFVWNQIKSMNVMGLGLTISVCLSCRN